jgi:hypothetical protein
MSQNISIRREFTLTVPDYGQHWDMDQLIDMVKRTGSHFFDADAMRFFRSKVDAYCVAGVDGWYFVTSEQHVMTYPTYRKDPRRYTVRRLSVKTATDNDKGDDLRLYELQGFQAYRTLEQARKAAKHYAERGAAICPDCSLRLCLENHATCTECEDYAERRMAKAN